MKKFGDERIINDYQNKWEFSQTHTHTHQSHNMWVASD